MHRFSIIVLGVALIIIVILLAHQSLGDGGSASEGSPRREEGSMVSFPSGTVVGVEIAQGDAQRMRGLSGRAGLPSGRGMLFLHDEPAVQSYWMKGMAFPIDIIWIDGDEIVGFVEAAQPEEPPLTIYTSPESVDKVLEVSSGFVAQNDLKIGDILDIELPDE